MLRLFLEVQMKTLVFTRHIFKYSHGTYSFYICENTLQMQLELYSGHEHISR